MRSSIRARLAAAAAAVGLTLGGPGPTGTPAAAADPLVLRAGTDQDLQVLNPFNSILVVDFEVFTLNYDLLVNFGPELNPVPGFADEWSVSDDGLTWTFHIREGMKWSDGTPATSEDARYTYQLALDADAKSQESEDGYYLAAGYLEPYVLNAGLSEPHSWRAGPANQRPRSGREPPRGGTLPVSAEKSERPKPLTPSRSAVPGAVQDMRQPNRNGCLAFGIPQRAKDSLSLPIVLDCAVEVPGIDMEERRHPERAPEEPPVLLLPSSTHDLGQLPENRRVLGQTRTSDDGALPSPGRVRTAAFLQEAAGFAKGVAGSLPPVVGALRLVNQYGSGKKILLMADNTPFFIVCYLSIIYSGNTVVLVETRISKTDLTQIINTSSLSAALVQKRYCHYFEDSGLDNMNEEILNESSEKEFFLHSPDMLGDDVAVIIFTSGSTGTKKGVMLTHKNLIANTGSIIEYLGLDETDRMCVVLPFFYCYGASLLHTHLRVGGSIVLNQNPFLSSVINDIDTYHCTGFAGVPPIHQCFA